MPNQRELVASENSRGKITLPCVRYKSGVKIIISCGGLPCEFQFICDQCLSEHEKAELASRRVSSGQADSATRSYRSDFIKPAASNDQIRQLDRKLLKMSCKDIKRKLIRSSDESDLLLPIQGTPIRAQKLVTSTGSPSKKQKRGTSQREVNSDPSDEESVTELVRQRLETVKP